MTELAKIAIDFESKLLSQITKFYREYALKGVVDLGRFNLESRNKAKISVKNFKDALAEQMYSIYGGDEKGFIKNKKIQTIFTKADDNILSSVSYAMMYASMFYSGLISKGQSQEQAYNELNELYSNGLKASPKYGFEGSINFIDNEAAFETDLTKNTERAIEKNVALVYIPHTYSACPKCSIWQGKYLIDDVYANGAPDGKHQLLSYAISMGFLHPNCRDTFIYVENEEHHKLREAKHEPKELRREVIRKRYEAEQRERELAKQARAWKRKKEDGIDTYNRKLIDARIDEKLEEARKLRDDGHMLRVNYRMFQTKYEYRSRRNWDVNSLRNR